MIVIVGVENNRVSKFAEVGSDQEAQEHIATFGGFVYPGSYRPDLWVDGENVSIQPVVVELTLKDYDIAIERELDRQAEESGYYDPLGRIPNIDRACSYAGHSNPYQAEGQSFVAWRAAVWAHVYQVKADVEAELRTQPTIEELIAELPQRVIPE
jgi:hypothetical protein